jgi:2-keto-4-pentenoate hydratase/2-oxohepta-3-ene-1,7-dioic acid hydratase in catechol pathway
MRFATIRTDQGTTAARLDGDVLTPLQAGDVGAMLAAGGAAGERDGAPAVPAAQADFAPVVTQPGKVICVGLNYRSHILETGRELPEYPTLFAKFAETLMGPRDDLVLPSVSERVDWEVELGVVIGKRCRYLADEHEAADAIAGYVLVNDVSERAFQLERGGQWVKGKSAETFNPCGPYLVTPDAVGDINNLNMWLDVNGVRRQTGSTATMLFGVTNLVHYLSQFMVLEPGDLINTGTPPGVGLGLTPPVWLQPGDVMELGMDNLGTQRQVVAAAP